jgi:hypothetical protein
LLATWASRVQLLLLLLLQLLQELQLLQLLLLLSGARLGKPAGSMWAQHMPAGQS